MTTPTSQGQVWENLVVSVSRRVVLGGVGAAVLGAGLGGCGSSSGSGRGVGRIRVVLVSPLTGAMARWGAGDRFVVDAVRSVPAFARGLRLGRKTYEIDIAVVDSRSDANVAIRATQQIALGNLADLVLATSGADTANPVAQVCASQGIPCLVTGVPWEMWYGGLGGHPARPSQKFQFCTAFFMGFRQFQGCFVPMWERAADSTSVGCLFPFDAYGTAFRAGFEPLVTGAGYQVVDGGAYTDGSSDFGAMVSLFKGRGCETFAGVPLLADFQAFWEQAARGGFRPRLATVANVAQVPADVAGLGVWGRNLAIASWWGPYMPVSSSLTGQSASSLASAYQARTGQPWLQTLGSTYTLFEVAKEALSTVSDPHDKQEVAAALHKVRYNGMCGPLDFSAGPAPGVAVVEPVGAQWQAASGKYPVELKVVDNSLNPAVPAGAPLQPTPV
ncbi:MAG TPA: ABC transporter substrate-binding protein [Streptosporangiaceae bacterium]|nr:ABC transporter substrate-binding protein [Streptosporangiaceae bacterium]